MKIDSQTILKKLKENRAALLRGGLSLLTVAVLVCASCASAWFMNAAAGTTAAGVEILNYDGGLRRTASLAKNSTLKITGSSVEMDLGVTVVNENEDIVKGVEFEFNIYNSSGKQAYNVVDDDMDGQVYISDVPAGEYTVEMCKMMAYAQPEPIKVVVQPQLTYQKIDVSDKVLEEKDVDVATEDKKYNEQSNTGAGTSTPAAANTVEYVVSSSKSETKTTETPVLDAGGNQVVKYKPVLSAGADGSSYLVFASGAVSTVIATVDADGYLVSAKRLDVGGEEQPSAGETPADPATPEQPATPTYTDVTSEVINADGTPVSENGAYRYQFTAVPQVTTKTETVTTYYGWQTLEGKTYYFDKNGKKVTGTQIINGISYVFNSDGSRTGGTTGTLGVDVSTWQENVDWAKVKASGVDYVFIRLGYRGYTKGALILDNEFRNHIAGASAAGLKVGVYFFTQAITEQEAIEEASMCLQYVQGWSISYPIAIDVEYSGGRADSLTIEQRTKICRAFCETIRNGGYTPAVYANKYYFESKMYTSQLESYIIWLAHYTDKTSYARRYDLWQYSSKGSVSGINGYVDMNLSYLGY
ncbi:MAG: GH25 family lysozyme [Oscillospiraceae bacterium]|nr:GH25 family lysozyme [Oscillospiraceae bacterium]